MRPWLPWLLVPRIFSLPPPCPTSSMSRKMRLRREAMFFWISSTCGEPGQGSAAAVGATAGNRPLSLYLCIWCGQAGPAQGQGLLAPAGRQPPQAAQNPGGWALLLGRLQLHQAAPTCSVAKSLTDSGLSMMQKFSGSATLSISCIAASAVGPGPLQGQARAVATGWKRARSRVFSRPRAALAAATAEGPR